MNLTLPKTTRLAALGTLHAPGMALDGRLAELCSPGKARLVIQPDGKTRWNHRRTYHDPITLPAPLPASAGGWISLGPHAAGPNCPVVWLPTHRVNGLPLTPEALNAHPEDSHCSRTRRSRLYVALDRLYESYGGWMTTSAAWAAAIEQLVRAYGETEVLTMMRTVREDYPEVGL